MHIVIGCLIVLGILSALGFIYRTTLKAFFTKVTPGVSAKGSAFVKVAEADTRATELRGKVIALKAANAVAHGTADELEKAAADVHEDADAVHDRLTAVENQL